MRTVRSEYHDPLGIVWLATCRRWGWNVRRSDQVFAAWDGKSTLTIGTQETLDPDDSLAQLILHEFCHAMVEGPDSWQLADWGLDITDRSQLFHEHACLILQAAVSDSFGLRTFFGSTTDARAFYDRLPSSPEELSQRLCRAAEADCQSEDATTDVFAMAAAGLKVAQSDRFWNPLQEALATTASLAKLVKPFADDSSLWSTVANVEGSSEVLL